MYIASGQGQKAPKGQKFYVNRKALSLYPFVAKFKEISLKSVYIYIFIFHDLIHVYSPGAGTESPQGTQFYPFVASFKEISLKSDFIHFFMI